MTNDLDKKVWGLLESNLKDVFKDLSEDGKEFENWEKRISIIKNYLKKLKDNYLKNLLEKPEEKLKESLKNIKKPKDEEIKIFKQFIKDLLGIALVLRGLKNKIPVQNVDIDQIIKDMGITDIVRLKNTIDAFLGYINNVEDIDIDNDKFILIFKNSDEANRFNNTFRGILTLNQNSEKVEILEKISDIKSRLQFIESVLNNIRKNVDKILFEQTKDYIGAATKLFGESIEGIDEVSKSFEKTIENVISRVKRAGSKLDEFQNIQKFEEKLEKEVLMKIFDVIKGVSIFDNLLDIFDIIWALYLISLSEKLVKELQEVVGNFSVSSNVNNELKRKICEKIKKLFIEEIWEVKTDYIGSVKDKVDIFESNITDIKVKKILKKIFTLLNKSYEELNNICSQQSQTP